MATRQGLDSSIVNRLGADEQAMFLAIKAEFDSGTVRLWTGIDDLTISSESYIGAGELLSIGSVEESTDLKSAGLTVGISGMDTTVLNLALTENYQNRFITLFLGYLMGGTNEVAGTLVLFKGRMTTLSVTDTPKGSNITINAENRLIDLERHPTLDIQKNHKIF